MIGAGLPRAHVRRSTALLTVLSAVAALLTGVLALAPVAGAATAYVGPFFGPTIAVPDGIGADYSYAHTNTNCPAGSVVTSIGIDIRLVDASSSWLNGVEPNCSPV